LLSLIIIGALAMPNKLHNKTNAIKVAAVSSCGATIVFYVFCIDFVTVFNDLLTPKHLGITQYKIDINVLKIFGPLSLLALCAFFYLFYLYRTAINRRHKNNGVVLTKSQEVVFEIQLGVKLISIFIGLLIVFFVFNKAIRYLVGY